MAFEPLGEVTLLGEVVPVLIAAGRRVLNAPCIYEFRATLTGSAAGGYVGLAEAGIGRPVEAYAKQLKILRSHRLAGLRPSTHPSGGGYRRSNPWGFRWVHHELERLLWAKSQGADVQLSLVISPMEGDTNRVQLRAEEVRRIVALREELRAAGGACWNDGDAMSSSRAELDDCWRP